jgi:hypothetical protein
LIPLLTPLKSLWTVPLMPLLYLSIYILHFFHFLYYFFPNTASVDLFPLPFWGGGGKLFLGVSVLVAYPQGGGRLYFPKNILFCFNVAKKAWFTSVMEILWATKSDSLENLRFLNRWLLYVNLFRYTVSFFVLPSQRIKKDNSPTESFCQFCQSFSPSGYIRQDTEQDIFT